MPPGLAGVDRLINSVAGRQIGALQALAAADVDRFGVGRGDGERADGAGRLVVKDRRPSAAVVVRLPNAAVVCGDIEKARVARNAGGSNRPAAAERADRSPAHVAVKGRRDLLGSRREGQGEQSENAQPQHGTTNGSHVVW